MVGAALACGLGGSPLRVAVIEDSPPPPFDPGQPHDLRVSAVSVASVNILKAVGAWRGVTGRRLCPFRRMRVWEQGGDVEFRSEDLDQPVLGYIVENRVIQWALLERLAAFPNVALFCPAEARIVEYTAAGSRIALDGGRRVEGRLLVAADGGGSRVRQIAGLGVAGWDYPQWALVLTVDTGYPQQDITWQRFTPAGPQAFLPLDGAHASLVWYEAPDQVQRLRTLPDPELLAELAARFPPELGPIARITARGSFPLKRQHALAYIKEGVALVGDAAHMIHPLAGQGVNIGLLDAAALAETLVTARREGRDIGSCSVLSRYEAMRRSNNLVMMTIMDLFYRVFGNAHPPLRLARNLGLGLADRLRPAKQMAMRYAMGLMGQLPRLARGEALVG